jgi:hypothetical protein
VVLGAQGAGKSLLASALQEAHSSSAVTLLDTGQQLRDLGLVDECAAHPTAARRAQLQLRAKEMLSSTCREVRCAAGAGSAASTSAAVRWVATDQPIQIFRMAGQRLLGWPPHAADRIFWHCRWMHLGTHPLDQHRSIHPCSSPSACCSDIAGAVHRNVDACQGTMHFHAQALSLIRLLFLRCGHRSKSLATTPTYYHHYGGNR